MADPQWAVFEALRAPYSLEVWRLTLEELASCPRCGSGTRFIPFPPAGQSAASLEGVAPRAMPPLDAAVFLCCQRHCLSIYVIVFSAARQAEFRALIPYLREAGRRAVLSEQEEAQC